MTDPDPNPMPDALPGAVSDIERRVAITSARFAATRRLPLTACPYNPAADGRQYALAVLWVHIYRRHLPTTV